jgi:hypothetical protein
MTAALSHCQIVARYPITYIGDSGCVIEMTKRVLEITHFRAARLYSIA